MKKDLSRRKKVHAKFKERKIEPWIKLKFDFKINNVTKLTTTTKQLFVFIFSEPKNNHSFCYDSHFLLLVQNFFASS